MGFTALVYHNIKYSNENCRTLTITPVPVDRRVGVCVLGGGGGGQRQMMMMTFYYTRIKIQTQICPWWQTQQQSIGTFPELYTPVTGSADPKMRLTGTLNCVDSKTTTMWFHYSEFHHQSCNTFFCKGCSLSWGRNSSPFSLPCCEGSQPPPPKIAALLSNQSVD